MVPGVQKIFSMFAKFDIFSLLLNIALALRASKYSTGSESDSKFLYLFCYVPYPYTYSLNDI